MIDLTALKVVAQRPRLLDPGSELQPPFGGVTQRLDRLGGRHAIEVTIPPYSMEPEGRVWVSRLKRAKREGGRIWFPQPDFDPGNPGTPVVAAAVSGGTSVPLSGLTAGYVIREGQWLSVTTGGRSYLYSVDAQVAATGGGAASVVVTPMLRTPLAANDVVNLSAPIVEGWVAGDELAWEIDLAANIGASITITERA